jgi:hypothetical protein
MRESAAMDMNLKIRSSRISSPKDTWRVAYWRPKVSDTTGCARRSKLH